jgi:hypothetical protein
MSESEEEEDYFDEFENCSQRLMLSDEKNLEFEKYQREEEEREEMKRELMRDILKSEREINEEEEEREEEIMIDKIRCEEIIKEEEELLNDMIRCEEEMKKKEKGMRVEMEVSPQKRFESKRNILADERELEMKNKIKRNKLKNN